MGDVLVMFTDGIAGKIHLTELEKSPRFDVEQLARRILTDHGNDTDDAGVLVARMARRNDDEYTDGLQEYLSNPGEEDLYRGYEIGRKALDEGRTSVDIVVLHFEALVSVLSSIDTEEDSRALASDAVKFSLEALSSFEITHRGLLDSVELLSQNARDFVKTRTVIQSQNQHLSTLIESLRANEEKYRILVESSPYCLYQLNSDGRLMSMNRAGLRLLNREHERSVEGLSFLSLVNEDDADQASRCMQAALAGEYSEFECWTISGSAIRTNFVPITDKHGTVNWLLGISQDISEQKLAEEEKKELQASLRHTQKMEAVGQLAAGVAHEFNNALVGILMNAELLQKQVGDDLSESSQRMLNDIQRSGERAASLTKQLLTFSRKRTSMESSFDVNQVILDSERMLHRLAGDSITLETKLSPHPVVVRADEGEVEQAIINLARNAVDAMPQGGTLTIQTDVVSLQENEVSQDSKAGSYGRLSVVDNGCGMSQETKERIFEPFFSTKEIGEGTGLGLATVFADMTKSKGFVSVESELGQGSVFHIHLPSDLDERVKKETGQITAPADSSRGSETILLCDDNEFVRNAYATLLELNSYTVLSTATADEALSRAASHVGAISLLLTDVSMPEKNGWQLAAEIVRDYPDTKVIYMSGYAADVFDDATAMGENFKLLQKPIPGEMLCRRVRELLDSSKDI